MASGIDQARIVDFMQASFGQSANASSPYTAVLLNPFSASSSQLGHIRLMTANGSSTANGTELFGGSYIPLTGITYTTGPGGAFGSASYTPGTGGQIATGVTLSQAGMPTVPSPGIVGIEIWDSASPTPLRWWWAALTSSIPTSSGNTLSFGAGAISALFNA